MDEHLFGNITLISESVPLQTVYDDVQIEVKESFFEHVFLLLV